MIPKSIITFDCGGEEINILDRYIPCRYIQGITLLFFFMFVVVGTASHRPSTKHTSIL